MRVLLAQLNPIVGDLEKNTEKIVHAIAKGKKQNADVVLFSEMVLTGYPPEDFLLLPHFIHGLEPCLEKIKKATTGIAAIVGTPRLKQHGLGKKLYNSAAVFHNGSLLGYQDKILLPTYDVFTERRYFDAGTQNRLWNLGGKQIALTICEDLWQHSTLLGTESYIRDPVMELVELHPHAVFNLSASPFSVGKPRKRFDVCAKAAVTLRCPVVLCNQVGGNDGLIFDGYSLYVDSKGHLKEYCKGFEEDTLLIDLETAKPDKQLPDVAVEDLYNALVLGVRDYFRKSGFTKAVLGLSGGIDSALVACIAAEALGAGTVLGVLMPSRYSSPGSLTDAVQLAKTLHMPTKEIPIEGPFKAYLDTLTPHFAGKEPDVTEENLQARIRGMILMALSNKFGYIVLSTGNKSELAMGYATLYGDMVGGLGVISDLTKRQVYELSRWINRNGEIIPLSTIQKPPSAELRPNQKDSDSLPDYDIVDNVLRAYVEEHHSPQEIAEQYGYPPDQVHDLVRKIHRNEYKRRQSAPGLRVSEKAFWVGRKFPIVQRWVQ